MPIVLNGSGAVTGLSQLPDSAMAAGSILQVVANNVTSPSSITMTNHSTLYNTPLTVNITSTVANSKFLVSGLISGEGSAGGDQDIAFVIRRTISGSSTSLSIGDAGAGIRVTRVMNMGFTSNNNDSTTSSSSIPPYLDSPSQAAGTTITYSFSVVEIGTNDGTTMYFNRPVNSSSGGGYERPASYITVMEVAV